MNLSVDYCIECCIKHGQTAKVLMREALQRAEAQDPKSDGVKEKIRGVVEELSGLEDDTNSFGDNEDIRKINAVAREVRKSIYDSKAEIGGADITFLREIRKKINDLVELTYSAREREQCTYCDEKSEPEQKSEQKIERKSGPVDYQRVVEKRRALIERIKKERES